MYADSMCLIVVRVAYNIYEGDTLVLRDNRRQLCSCVFFFCGFSRFSVLHSEIDVDVKACFFVANRLWIDFSSRHYAVQRPVRLFQAFNFSFISVECTIANNPRTLSRQLVRASVRPVSESWSIFRTVPPEPFDIGSWHPLFNAQ